MSGAGGRSAKTAPFWTRAWWTRDLVEMKMVGREPIRRVMMGPYLACRSGRTDSSSENDFRSHRKFPMNGTVMGPGGSLFFGKTRS